MAVPRPASPATVSRRGLPWLPLAVLVLLSSPASSPAQVPDWKIVQSPSAPGARSWHAAAFDDVRRRVMLFGGQNGPAIYGDTWQWNGTQWGPVATFTPGDPNSPEPRFAAGMANDVRRRRVVLFGGRTATRVVGDTFEWDGGGWTLVSTVGPSPRFGHALAYDDFTRSVVLFGGLEAGTNVVLDDTWSWDGTQWTRLSAGTPPAARFAHAMSSSPGGGVLLFGGALQNIMPLRDTWELIAGAWQPRCTAAQPCANNPAPRQAAAMTFDPTVARTVLVAGRGMNNMPMMDTWLWGPATWGAALTGIEPRAYHTVTYDPLRQRAVLYGGLGPIATLDDTWELSFSGQPCTTASQCASGFCVDGVCCQDACTGTCRRCDLPNATGTKDGQCRNALNATDPDADCPTLSTAACTGACDGGGSCRYPGNDTPCATCTVCDGAGKCAAIPKSQDDAACPPVPCSRASNQCRTYADQTTNVRRCLAIGRCGFRWADCRQFTAQPDATQCNTGAVRAYECRNGFCTSK